MRLATCATVISLALAAGSAGAASIPAVGPDAFGYRGDTVASNLRDISASGTGIATGDEVMSGPISIGFDFDFYGSTFSQLHVSSNGFIDFDGGGPSIGLPQPIPSAANGGRIGGFLRDHNPSSIGSLRYDTVGATGNQQFIVGFYGVPRYGTSSELATFEMILHEVSGDIEFQYGAITDTAPGDASVGIESPDGLAGLSLLFGDIPDSNTGYCVSLGSISDVCGVGNSPSVVPVPSSLSLMAAIGGIGFGLGWARRGGRSKRIVSQA